MPKLAVRAAVAHASRSARGPSGHGTPPTPPRKWAFPALAPRHLLQCHELHTRTTSPRHRPYPPADKARCILASKKLAGREQFCGAHCQEFTKRRQRLEAHARPCCCARHRHKGKPWRGRIRSSRSTVRHDALKARQPLRLVDSQRPCELQRQLHTVMLR